MSFFIASSLGIIISSFALAFKYSDYKETQADLKRMNIIKYSQLLTKIVRYK